MEEGSPPTREEVQHAPLSIRCSWPLVALAARKFICLPSAWIECTLWRDRGPVKKCGGRGTRDVLTQSGGDHGNNRHERERMAMLQRLPLPPHGGGRRAEAPVSYILSRHGHNGCRCGSASLNCRRRCDSVRITFVFTIP